MLHLLHRDSDKEYLSNANPGVPKVGEYWWVKINLGISCALTLVLVKRLTNHIAEISSWPYTNYSRYKVMDVEFVELHKKSVYDTDSVFKQFYGDV